MPKYLDFDLDVQNQKINNASIERTGDDFSRSCIDTKSVVGPGTVPYCIATCNEY